MTTKPHLHVGWFITARQCVLHKCSQRVCRLKSSINLTGLSHSKKSGSTEWFPPLSWEKKTKKKPYRGLRKRRDFFQQVEADFPEAEGKTAWPKWAGPHRKTRGKRPWGRSEGHRWCRCLWCKETRWGRPRPRGVRSELWGRPEGPLRLWRSGSVGKHQAHGSPGLLLRLVPHASEARMLTSLNVVHGWFLWQHAISSVPASRKSARSTPHDTWKIEPPQTSGEPDSPPCPVPQRKSCFRPIFFSSLPRPQTLNQRPTFPEASSV